MLGLIIKFVKRSIKVGKILKVLIVFFLRLSTKYCALDLEPTYNYSKIISFLRKS